MSRTSTYNHSTLLQTFQNAVLIAQEIIAMFSLRALSSTLMVLLTCGVAVAQHEVGGGSTSGSATSTDSGRGGSVRVRRAPARAVAPRRTRPAVRAVTDRKSTRLNSSHSQISYAVFCLKKKKSNTTK